eukprot:gene35305-43528_t
MDQYGSIFGGYLDIPWNVSSYGTCTAPDSFLFSLRRGTAVVELELFQIEIVKKTIPEPQTFTAPTATVPVVDSSVLPTVASSLQVANNLYAEVQKYCEELIRVDAELQQEAVEFRDELFSSVGKKRKASTDTTSSLISDAPKSFDKILKEIEAGVQLMTEGQTVTTSSSTTRLPVLTAPP